VHNLFNRLAAGFGVFIGGLAMVMYDWHPYCGAVAMLVGLGYAIYVPLSLGLVKRNVPRMFQLIIWVFVMCVIVAVASPSVKEKLFPLPLRPLSPGHLTAYPTVEDSFRYGGRITKSQVRTPCFDPTRETRSISANRPVLSLMPERYVLKNNADRPDRSELFIEASVTNDGHDSIARGWRLCLVQEGKAVYYYPQDIGPSDLREAPTKFPDKRVLEESARSPIKRGDMASGWLLFYLPPSSDLNVDFNGSLECTDYQGNHVFAGFMPEKR